MGLVAGTTLMATYGAGRTVYYLQREYEFGPTDYLGICLPLIVFCLAVSVSFLVLRQGIAYRPKF